jgi:hypothetical protein
MPVEDIVGSTLLKWTAGKKGKAAMIAVFEKICDIPYGVLPTGEEEIYFPDEAELMPPPDLDNNARAFYQGLNAHFQGIRDGQR